MTGTVSAGDLCHYARAAEAADSVEADMFNHRCVDVERISFLYMSFNVQVKLHLDEYAFLL